MKPLVLCYHAVSDGWPHALAVPPADFERQLRALLRLGYRPIDAETALAGGGRLLHVTFDDAYRSVAERALPVLERLGVPATVFACSGFAGDGRPLAIPELADEVAAHPDELATLDWDGLCALAERGVEIGAHTETHAHLPRLGDEELRRELRGAREALEEGLGRRVPLLAYPFGEHDERVRAAARAAGYRAAFALEPRGADPFAFPRVGIYRRDRLLRALAKCAAVRRR